MPNLLASHPHDVEQVEVIGDLFLLMAVTFCGLVVADQQSADVLAIIRRLCLLQRIGPVMTIIKLFQQSANPSRERSDGCALSGGEYRISIEKQREAISHLAGFLLRCRPLILK